MLFAFLNASMYDDTFQKCYRGRYQIIHILNLFILERISREIIKII